MSYCFYNTFMACSFFSLALAQLFKIVKQFVNGVVNLGLHCVWIHFCSLQLMIVLKAHAVSAKLETKNILSHLWNLWIWWSSLWFCIFSFCLYIMATSNIKTTPCWNIQGIFNLSTLRTRRFCSFILASHILTIYALTCLHRIVLDFDF